MFWFPIHHMTSGVWEYTLTTFGLRLLHYKITCQLRSYLYYIKTRENISFFVCLDALISETIRSIWKILLHLAAYLFRKTISKNNLLNGITIHKKICRQSHKQTLVYDLYIIFNFNLHFLKTCLFSINNLSFEFFKARLWCQNFISEC